MSKITIDKEVLDLALAAFVRAEVMYGQPNFDIQDKLREALAQPQPVQEPVARVRFSDDAFDSVDWIPYQGKPLKDGDLLYTSPQQPPPPPPPECKTEAERTAYAFGWFKALEAVNQKKEVK